MDESTLRQEISEKVTQLYKLRESNELPFTPGKTPVRYAGRIYDEKELISLVNSSLDFWLTTGKYADQFESEFSKFIGVKYCSLTNSGSSANLLAISALTSKKLSSFALQPGDEVITTACGFPTTLNPIIQNNLIPVFIDVELGNYNIKTDQITEAISNKTNAIFIPHTLGNPVDIKVIKEIADDNGLWLIEDNCDAYGSKFDGKSTGSFGDISTCSFYPAHMATMGEAGAVLTDDRKLNQIINSFRDWGRDCSCNTGNDNKCGKRFDQQFGALPLGYDHKYVYSHIGYNLKVTDMQAAIGVEQLKKIPVFIEKRKHNFRILYNGLKRYQKYILLPEWEIKADPCWFGFPILVIPSAPFTRNQIVKYLEDNKIATRMLFGGNLTKQPAYSDITCRIHKDLKNTDLVMTNLFWIGVYPGLTTEMIDYVLDTFNKFFEEVI